MKPFFKASIILVMAMLFTGGFWGASPGATAEQGHNDPVEAVPDSLPKPVLNAPGIKPGAKILEPGLYDYDDFITDLFNDAGSDVQGVKTYMEAIHLFFKLLDLQMDDETERVNKKLRPMIDAHEFKKIYDLPMLEKLDDNYRGKAFYGSPEVLFHQIRIAQTGFDNTRLKSFGDFAVEFGLKVDDSNADSFLFNMRMKSATRHFSHRTLNYFLLYLMRTVDPDNIKAMNAPDTPSFHHITGPSRKAINQLSKTFPLCTSFADRYVRLQSYVKPKRHENVDYTHVALKFCFNHETLNEDFPHIGRYQEELFSHIQRVYIKMLDPKGHLLVAMVINGPENYVSFNALTKEGKVIPFDESGTPILEDAFYPSPMKDFFYHLDVKTYSRFLGAVFVIDQVKIKVEFKPGDVKESLLFKLDSPPMIKFYGSGIDYVPTWLVKWFVPDMMIYKVNIKAGTLYSGNNGKGTYGELSWDPENPYDSNTYFSFSTEVPMNFFPGIGFKILKPEFLPDQATVLEYKGFLTKFLSEFVRDILPVVIRKVPTDE